MGGQFLRTGGFSRDTIVVAAGAIAPTTSCACCSRRRQTEIHRRRAGFPRPDQVGSPKGHQYGGHFAHLGGALFGWLFVFQLRSGNDWSAPVNNFWTASAPSSAACLAATGAAAAQSGVPQPQPHPQPVPQQPAGQPRRGRLRQQQQGLPGTPRRHTRQNKKVGLRKFPRKRKNSFSMPAKVSPTAFCGGSISCSSLLPCSLYLAHPYVSGPWPLSFARAALPWCCSATSLCIIWLALLEETLFSFFLGCILPDGATFSLISAHFEIGTKFPERSIAP